MAEVDAAATTADQQATAADASSQPAAAKLGELKQAGATAVAAGQTATAQAADAAAAQEGEQQQPGYAYPPGYGDYYSGYYAPQAYGYAAYGPPGQRGVAVGGQAVGLVFPRGVCRAALPHPRGAAVTL
jgi:hypothetical protein